MSDDEARHDRDREDITEPPGEPEGGPLARQEAFLEERTAALRPAIPPESEASIDEAVGAFEGPAGADQATSDEELFDAASRAVPEDFRLRRLAQFRRAQQAQDPSLADADVETSAEQPTAPGESDDEPSDESSNLEAPDPPGARAPEPPPEPPVPPPAENWVPIGPSVLRQGPAGRCPTGD